MPINELETHPFLNYLVDGNYPLRNDYKGLIIGSFPVYGCTSTLGQNLEIVEERLIPNEVFTRFFYASKKNKFWEYISKAHAEKVNPIVPIPNENSENRFASARRRVEGFLEQNNLLITDVLVQTNRNGLGSEDTDLFVSAGANDFILQNLKLNHGIRNILEVQPQLTSIYFTSTVLSGKSPFGWFKEIFTDFQLVKQNVIAGRTWSIIGMIKNRKYNIFLLPTPKPRGVHFSDERRVQMFVNYMASTVPEFYAVISTIKMKKRTAAQSKKLSELRVEFLVECYRQAFIESNLNFTGIV